MTEKTAAELREDYLARLDEAMRGLPHGVASDIRGGIAEELDGLDAVATAERIDRLGDPRGIAREAEDEVPTAPPVVFPAPAPAPSAPRTPTTATRGFAIAAALTLSFGGIVVPVVGWFVGAVLVSLSPLWRTWEKAVAILVPFVATGMSFLIASTMTGFSTGSASGSSTDGEVMSEVVNPLVPAFGEWHLLLLLGALLVPISGLWLLWRMRGRAAR
ncbi:HAAS signaling domain-containing protein [Microbacterium paraoxydans]|uniref:HAAS signaling domain-containing protein n=1 Tax=Microbacterium paraoxydans TaxID=199592 RepID=UPI003014007C